MRASRRNQKSVYALARGVGKRRWQEARRQDAMPCLVTRCHALLSHKMPFLVAAARGVKSKERREERLSVCLKERLERAASV